MISLEVNGKRYDVEVSPEVSLLWVLREYLKLTGTKYGCGASMCGACTVHVDGRAQRSCQLAVGDVKGQKITTIEGIPEDHPVKKVWRLEQVPQCGYCQPGQSMQAISLLTEDPNPSDENPGAWKNVTFDHSKTSFPLAGGHVGVQCSTCHVNGVYRGTPKECVSCHASKDPHAGQFGTVCSTCHNTSAWKNVTFNHGNTAFPLSGSHTTVACKSCHVINVYKGTPKNCYGCHAGRDKHNGQFGTDCGSCHKTTKWSDVSFNHNNTAFPLSGKHSSVQCGACHTTGVYKGTPSNCYACHTSKDKHNGQFGTNCGSCHTTNSWTGAAFNHNNTRFPLVGKHTNLECTKCHRNGVYKGTSNQCIACHEDKHNGEKGTDCGTCHTPTDWGKINQ